MKRFLLVAVLGVLAACSKSEPAPAAKAAHGGSVAIVKDPATAKKLIAEGAVVLDVRSPQEFSGEHLPTATNLPVAEVPQRLAEVEKLTGGDKAKPVVVYCGAGGRAQKAKVELEAAGYTNVVNGGGYSDLK
jgi:phage shock protein E